MNSLIVLCLSVCLFSVCKFSNFIQYSTVEYSTVQVFIGRSLVEWTSVFETLVHLFIYLFICLFVCLFVLCGQIFSFYTVQILTFADDSSLTLKATKLANSLVYPERIQRGKSGLQFLKRLFCVPYSLSANFLIFIQYSTEEYSTVQVFIWCLDTIA